MYDGTYHYYGYNALLYTSSASIGVITNLAYSLERKVRSLPPVHPFPLELEIEKNGRGRETLR